MSTNKLLCCSCVCITSYVISKQVRITKYIYLNSSHIIHLLSSHTGRSQTLVTSPQTQSSTYARCRMESMKGIVSKRYHYQLPPMSLHPRLKSYLRNLIQIEMALSVDMNYKWDWRMSLRYDVCFAMMHTVFDSAYCLYPMLL